MWWFYYTFWSLFQTTWKTTTKMSFFIKIDNLKFKISKTLATSLRATKNPIQSQILNNEFIFNINSINLFQELTSTPKCFYVTLSKKKHRISRKFYEYLEKRLDSQNRKLFLVDLCSGTGSALLASLKYSQIIHTFSNDFCMQSKKIFLANFDSDAFNSLDLCKINSKDVPIHDILISGFPCQPFSIAGNRQGFADSRAQIFWDLIRIIKCRTPRFVILENVKNLRAVNKGQTLNLIIKNLESLGYHVKIQVLDVAKITDIPQHRERLFIFCFRNERDFKELDLNFSPVQNKNIIEFFETSVEKKYYISENSATFKKINSLITNHYTTGSLYQYRRSEIREYKNKSPTLLANMGTGGHNVPLIRDSFGIRKLTPRECFRLQGFPDSYSLNCSDSALYKLCGNAICVKVLDLLFERICCLINNKK